MGLRSPRLALALLGLGAACQGGGVVRPQVQEATIEALELREAGSGLLRLRVPSPGPLPARVEWALALEGRPFGVGLETVTTGGEGALVLEVPLAWRHFPWREGPRWVRVEVRGQVLSGEDPMGLPYRGAREVLVSGAPQLDAPLE
jgi:hypothetical protein